MEEERLSQAFKEASTEAESKRESNAEFEDLMAEAEAELAKIRELYELLRPSEEEINSTQAGKKSLAEARFQVEITIDRQTDDAGIPGRRVATLTPLDERTKVSVGKKQRLEGNLGVFLGYKVDFEFVPDDPQTRPYFLTDEYFIPGKLGDDSTVEVWALKPSWTAKKQKDYVERIAVSLELDYLRRQTMNTLRLLGESANRADLNPILAHRILSRQEVTGDATGN